MSQAERDAFWAEVMAPEVAARPSLFATGAAEVRALYRYRHLVRFLSSSELRKDHTGRVFGALWWVLDPLLLMATYVLLVGIILKRGGANYPVFVLMPIVAWKFFRISITHGIADTLSKGRSMAQIAYPKSVLPLSSTLAEFAYFVVGLGLYFVIAAIYGVYPTVYTPLVAVVMLVQLALCLGCTFALSALNFIFRDIQNLALYLLRMTWWLSPGLYSIDRVPVRWRHVFMLNPFATLFPAYRDVLMYGRMPNMRDFGIVAAFSLVVMVAGFLVFVRMEPLLVKAQ